jgi:hypothetical protein
MGLMYLPQYCNEFSYRFNRRGAQLFDGTLWNILNEKAVP